MTDVQDVTGTAEPSMEEILASIRRIIADEKDPDTAAAAPEEEPKDEVLELTQMVQDDGSIVSVKDTAEPIVELEPIPEPAPVPDFAFAAPDPTPVPAPASMMVKEEADALLSNLAESAATSSLAALASTVNVERKASFTGFTPLGDGGKTIEGIVMELMKPMLKEWLDQNLPPVVERIVQKEVERIARRVQD